MGRCVSRKWCGQHLSAVMLAWLTHVAYEWLQLALVYGLLDGLRAAVARRRLASVQWIDDGCVLSAGSRVRASAPLAEFVEQLRWMERTGGEHTVALVDVEPAREHLHNLRVAEETALGRLRDSACLALLVHQIFGRGWVLAFMAGAACWDLIELLALLMSGALPVTAERRLSIGFFAQRHAEMSDVACRQICLLDMPFPAYVVRRIAAVQTRPLVRAASPAPSARLRTTT